MGHYLTNGNKRMALTFLKAIMWEFGYYLKFTEGSWKDYAAHKTIIEKFAMNMETKINKGIKIQTRKDIWNWIKNNAIIGLHWREQDETKN